MTSVQKRSPRSMPLHELTSSTASPVATVSANLMPPEITARRRLAWLKRRLGFALLALTLLIGLGYALVRQSTSSSRDDLASAQTETATLSQRAASFSDVVRVQSETAQIRSRLAGIMSTDVSWSSLVSRVGAAAPAGVEVDAVEGKLTGSDTQTAATTPPLPGVPTGIGTLTLTGSARDYASVAVFVNALTRVPGFTSVEPGTLGTQGQRATFTIALTITRAALTKRFTQQGAR